MKPSEIVTFQKNQSTHYGVLNRVNHKKKLITNAFGSWATTPHYIYYINSIGVKKKDVL
jgi:hypothetical protein